MLKSSANHRELFAARLLTEQYYNIFLGFITAIATLSVSQSREIDLHKCLRAADHPDYCDPLPTTPVILIGLFTLIRQSSSTKLER
jgi:hypothetical protein